MMTANTFCGNCGGAWPNTGATYCTSCGKKSVAANPNPANHDVSRPKQAFSNVGEVLASKPAKPVSTVAPIAPSPRNQEQAIGSIVKSYGRTQSKVAAMFSDGVTIDLHEHGLVYESIGRASGHKEQCRRVITFDDVTSVRCRIFGSALKIGKTNAVEEYILTPRGGRTVTLDNAVPNIAELGKHVVAQVSNRLFPIHLARVSNGGTVNYGPFAVGANQLGYRGKTIEWGAVEYIQVFNGELSVHERGQNRLRSWAAVAAADVENFGVLVALLRRVVNVR